MRQITAVAEELRLVREAHRLFLLRWRIGEALTDPSVLDRLAVDLEQVAPNECANASHDEIDDLAGDSDFSGSPMDAPRRMADDS